MADLDPSSRASKRRRTGTYANARTKLNSTAPEKGTAETPSKRRASGKENREWRPAANLSNTPDESELEDSTGGHMAAEQNILAETGVNAYPSTATGTSRRRKSQRVSDAASATRDDTPMIDSPEASGRAGSISGDHDQESQDEGSKRTSRRPRRAPRRYSASPEPMSRSIPARKAEPAKIRKLKRKGVSTATATPDVQSPQPKGILTPSRGEKKRGGQRKSVAFDHDERSVENLLGFKDIDSSTKKSKKSPKDFSGTPGSGLLRENLSPAPPATLDEDIAMDDSDHEVDSMLNEVPDVDSILAIPMPQDVVAESRDDDGDEEALVTPIKSIVLARTTSNALPPLSAFPHLSQQYSTVHKLLSPTISTGESNSLLLLGPRGSGKTLLLEHALADLSKTQSGHFHTVRLNGFIQTDDKLALRSIWRQLGREMALPQDETEEVSSYADTMASLLSLLSHPEELDPTSVVGDHGEKISKSVVFILDEFDLFTTHSRQTLLYNLFDIAQSRKAPIAVIGCSTRMDVVDCLEKRVKSRFSHRWLHVPGVRTLKEFEAVAQDCLTISTDNQDDLGAEEKILEARERWNTWIRSTFVPSKSVQSLLQHTFYTSKSLAVILSSLYIPLATANVSSASTPAFDSTGQASLLSTLPHIPLLHLTLLVTAARLITIHSLPSLTLSLIHNTYTSLLSRSKLQRSIGSYGSGSGNSFAGSGLRQWSKPTVRAAWEDLAEWQMVVPVSAREEGGEASGTRMWRVDVSLEEVGWAVREKLGNVGAGEILGRWCREM